MTRQPLGLEGRRIARADVVADHGGRPSVLSLAFEDGHAVTLTKAPGRGGVYMALEPPPEWGAEPAARWAAGLRPGAEVVHVEALQRDGGDEEPLGLRIDLADEGSAFVYSVGDVFEVCDELPGHVKDELSPARRVIGLQHRLTAVVALAVPLLAGLYFVLGQPASYLDAMIYVAWGFVAVFTVVSVVMLGRVAWRRRRLTPGSSS